MQNRRGKKDIVISASFVLTFNLNSPCKSVPLHCCHILHAPLTEDKGYIFLFIILWIHISKSLNFQCVSSSLLCSNCSFGIPIIFLFISFFIFIPFSERLKTSCWEAHLCMSSALHQDGFGGQVRRRKEIECMWIQYMQEGYLDKIMKAETESGNCHFFKFIIPCSKVSRNLAIQIFE